MKKMIFLLLLPFFIYACDSTEKHTLTLEVTDTHCSIDRIVIRSDDGNEENVVEVSNACSPYVYNREFDQNINFFIDIERQAGGEAVISVYKDGECRRTGTTSCYAYHLEGWFR